FLLCPAAEAESDHSRGAAVPAMGAPAPSAGAHGRNQPEADAGKDDEDRQLYEVGDDEGRDALVDRPDRDVRLDAFEDEDVESQGRVDEAGLDHAEIDDAPPQHVIAEMQHQGRDDWHGDDHHRAEQQIDEQDDGDDGDRRPVEMRQEGGRAFGQRADPDEERENLRTEDQPIDHRRRGGGARHHMPEGAAFELAAEEGAEEGFEGADRRRLGRGEDSEIYAAKHAAEKQRRRAAARQGRNEAARLDIALDRRRGRRDADIDGDGEEVERGREQPWQDRGDEELPDRGFREQREKNERARGRR